MVATLLQLYNNAIKQEKWYNRSGSAKRLGNFAHPVLQFFPSFPAILGFKLWYNNIANRSYIMFDVWFCPSEVA